MKQHIQWLYLPILLVAAQIPASLAASQGAKTVTYLNPGRAYHKKEITIYHIDLIISTLKKRLSIPEKSTIVIKRPIKDKIYVVNKDYTVGLYDLRYFGIPSMLMAIGGIVSGLMGSFIGKMPKAFDREAKITEKKHKKATRGSHLWLAFVPTLGWIYYALLYKGILGEARPVGYMSDLYQMVYYLSMAAIFFMVSVRDRQLANHFSLGESSEKIVGTGMDASTTCFLLFLLALCHLLFKGRLPKPLIRTMQILSVYPMVMGFVIIGNRKRLRKKKKAPSLT